MTFEALGRPFSVRALPGLIIAMIPVVSFLAMGYKMACARMAMSQDYELPEWKNWKQLFVQGITARLIQVIWLSPAILSFVVLYFKTKEIAAATVASLSSLLAISHLLLVFFILLLIGAIFMPAAVLNYAAELKFKSAFSISLFRRMFSKAYAGGWIISSIYVAIISLLFITAMYFAGTYLPDNPAILASIIILFIEAVFFWLPGITYWTILGNAWGKSLYREMPSQQQSM